MNNVIIEVRGLLEGKYPEILEVINRLETMDSTIDPKYGTYCIFHRPNIAPKAYALWIFPGIDETTIQHYEKINAIKIPLIYRELLYTINGASIFELDLFGIPLSMAKEPPLLDRSTITPKDVSIANKDWIDEYRNIDRALFFFGSGPLSYDEGVGYFLNETGAVYSLKSNGEQIGRWETIHEFLKDEIKRAEYEYPKYEDYMSKLLSNENEKH